MAILCGYVDFLIAAALCLVSLCLWRRNGNSVATNWPVVGMLPALFCNASRVFEFSFEVLNSCGGTFEFKGPWFGKLDFLITSEPMNVHHVFSRNFANYPKGGEFKLLFEPLGDGIFNVDSDVWAAQRKTIHSLLRHGRFEAFFERVIRQKVAGAMIAVLERASQGAQQLDMQDVFQRFTFDTICLLVLGFDPKSLSEGFPQVSCQKAFDDMWEAEMFRNLVPEAWWKLQKRLQIGNEKKLAKATETLNRFLYQCISSKRAELSKRRKPTEEETFEFDLLTACLEEAAEQARAGSSLNSDEFLRDMALNLLVAGRDTVSACLSWFFWLVARNPEVERKILEEIKANELGEEGQTWRFISAAELKKLVYLHGALCETLRLYPPVPIEFKSPQETDVLPTGHRVNQGSRIYFSFYAMGRMEEIWGKDCMDFKPERWISDSGKIMHLPSYQFVAFNAGPRTCLGKDMAFTQMKMVATAVLRNYRIQVLEDHPVSPCASIILHMKRGLKVRVKRRV